MTTFLRTDEIYADIRIATWYNDADAVSLANLVNKWINSVALVAEFFIGSARQMSDLQQVAKG